MAMGLHAHLLNVTKLSGKYLDFYCSVGTHLKDITSPSKTHKPVGHTCMIIVKLCSPNEWTRGSCGADLWSTIFTRVIHIIYIGRSISINRFLSPVGNVFLCPFIISGMTNFYTTFESIFTSLHIDRNKILHVFFVLTITQHCRLLIKQSKSN